MRLPADGAFGTAQARRIRLLCEGGAFPLAPSGMHTGTNPPAHVKQHAREGLTIRRPQAEERHAGGEQQQQPWTRRPRPWPAYHVTAGVRTWQACWPAGEPQRAHRREPHRRWPWPPRPAAALSAALQLGRGRLLLRFAARPQGAPLALGPACLPCPTGGAGGRGERRRPARVGLGGVYVDLS